MLIVADHVSYYGHVTASETKYSIYSMKDEVKFVEDNPDKV